jgi:hypothetical protein
MRATLLLIVVVILVLAAGRSCLDQKANAGVNTAAAQSHALPHATIRPAS